MFYSTYVLTKKGPLAKIWLAAHWDKKLTKQQIFDTDLTTTVDRIEEPAVPIALRTSGHLLLGVVRIYSRKVKYLLAECNEALVKIKMQFIPTKVDLPEKSTTAPFNSITLPEKISDVELMIPEAFTTLQPHADSRLITSRIEDITLEEDASWVAVPRAAGPEEEPSALSATPEEARRISAQPEVIEPAAVELGGIEFGPEKEGEEEQPSLGEAELMSVESPRPGMEAEVPGVTTPEGGEEVPTPRIRRVGTRRARLQVDEDIEMSQNTIRRNLEDTSDIVRERKVAPSTNEEMQQKEKRNVTVEHIYQNPIFDIPSELAKLLKRNAEVPVARREEEVEEAREAPTTALEEGAEGIPAFGPEIEEPLQEPEEEPELPEMPTTPEGRVSLGPEVSGTPSPLGVRAREEFEGGLGEAVTEPKKKRRRISREEKEREAQMQEQVVQQYGKGITERTLRILGIFGKSFEQQNELSFKEMVAEKPRKVAARCFFETLVIKSKDFIDVKQDEPFGDIKITKTAHFSQSTQV
eukprot:gb/GECH01000103.1/.p1 GENE.gb/GECH01000103.1/~~gb/GECH01000103.1/.p1  ORF type:complete len:525 (+),score=165.31 gb/GECH01000103.1/:1-1575(+)